MALQYKVVAWKADYMLIIFKYVYKSLCYTRVFETKDALARNIVCF